MYDAGQNSSLHLTAAALAAAERRRATTAQADGPFVATPHYTRIKDLPRRAPRVLEAITEILHLMEDPTVVWQLKGKLARGGFHLMPENDFTPPEMAAKLAYTELQTLRLKLTNLVLYPPIATRSNPEPLDRLAFSAVDDMDILHAIRRESAAYLRERSDSMVFHELKNLCQLAIGNLQQMQVSAQNAAML